VHTVDRLADSLCDPVAQSADLNRYQIMRKKRYPQLKSRHDLADNRLIRTNELDTLHRGGKPYW
jgi:hypothetical protein